jgi:hypothetical protein
MKLWVPRRWGGASAVAADAATVAAVDSPSLSPSPGNDSSGGGCRDAFGGGDAGEEVEEGCVAPNRGPMSKSAET